MKASIYTYDAQPLQKAMPLIRFIILLLVAKYGMTLESERGNQNNPGESTSYSSYSIHLFKAQEEAKCLLGYGDQGGRTEDKKSFTSFICNKTSPTFTQCQECRDLIDTNHLEKRCQELCNYTHSCPDDCHRMHQEIDKLEKSVTILTERKEGLILNSPQVFCEDMSLPDQSPKFHIVVLKWSIEFDSNYSKISNTSFPIVFVIERKDMGKPDLAWDTRGKTVHLIQALNSPYRQMTYKYRVTAIGPNGPIARATSKETPTLDGFVSSGPPKRIYKVKEVVHKSGIDMLVGWDPPEDKPCDYKVIQNRQDGDGKPVSHRFTATDLEDGLEVWFYDLKFRETYDVGITSRRASWDGYESYLKSETFTMPSCLEAHRHRFDRCVPGPPRQIIQEDVSPIHDDDTESERGNIKIKWMPPEYTTETNNIKSYSLILGNPYNVKTLSLNHSLSPHSAFAIASLTRSQGIFAIPGNFTEYIIKNVTLNRRYPSALIASSGMGDSSPIYFTLQTYLQKEEQNEQFSKWIYFPILISTVTIIAVALFIIGKFLRKRKVKLARDKYFQSMDERDAQEWSIVPLNEKYEELKYLGEGLREKWEIDYNNLIMGDVIGQGAFGVVRRAKLPRDHAFQHRRRSHYNSDSGEIEMETVAVKMLKVSATKYDKEQLVKEIITMQNLGKHPQIVTLLGACTKGQSHCLVLEYCPGGDLLTFLRKVREKYWPTLGLSNRQKSDGESPDGWDWDRISFNIASTSRRAENSSIKYADTTSVSEFSFSRENQPFPANTVINHQYGRCSSTEDFSDNPRPINEKDILSYARQISMGMEYLERNRVVHRDLACRNILLMGDCKQVKISDFGLSRDIYTNIYHQKSNGKLPIKWMAIESIFTHVFTSKSDVWSFGILLWELVTLGGTPYPGLGNVELFQLLKSGYRMERPSNCSEELYALMKKCWRTSSIYRPNFTELRHYLEAMLEAAEPSLYLSLMADIPVDYFRLSSRSDLLEHESVLGESTASFGYNFSTCSSNNVNSNSCNNGFLPPNRKRKTSRGKFHLSTPESDQLTIDAGDGIGSTDEQLQQSPPSSLSPPLSDIEKLEAEPTVNHPLLTEVVVVTAEPSPNSSRSHYQNKFRSNSFSLPKTKYSPLLIARRGQCNSPVSPDSGLHFSDLELQSRSDPEGIWSEND